MVSKNVKRLIGIFSVFSIIGTGLLSATVANAATQYATPYIYPLYNTHCFLEDELFFIFKSINTIIKLKLIIVIKIPDSNPYVPKEKNL